MARVKDNYRNLSGADKAAIFMLSLEAEHSAVLLENMQLSMNKFEFSTV